jgi:hypothetical protein
VDSFTSWHPAHAFDPKALGDAEECEAFMEAAAQNLLLAQHWCAQLPLAACCGAGSLLVDDTVDRRWQPAPSPWGGPAAVQVRRCAALTAYAYQLFVALAGYQGAPPAACWRLYWHAMTTLARSATESGSWGAAAACRPALH